ncbi:hypothetical protein [Glycomyces sp. NPDC048151]|uniref:hypothetical protein n=1 Tax=Glycomyces sp. NPDC048151 TaxID=3364002 RepID=UPI00371563DA
MAYPPAPAPMQQPVPVKQGNGFGVTALVLGIIAIVGAWIPFVNVVSMILGGLALIFGIIALVVAGKRNGKGKGTGGTGLVLGVLAIGGAIAMNVLVFNAISDEADQIEQDTIADCVESGVGTEEECQQIWDDAEDSVYGE